MITEALRKMDSRQEHALSSTLNQSATPLIANEMATHVAAAA